MPSRIVREEILTSETVNSLTVHAELLYRRLLNLVDDYGRFDARGKIVRLRAYPLQLDRVREADVTRWLAECQQAGAIALYEIDGRPYLVIPKVQTPRSDLSKIPEPPADVFCWRPPKAKGDKPYQGKLQQDKNICAQLIASARNGLQVPASVSYSDTYSDSTTGGSSDPPDPKAQAESDARTFARNWIAAECATYLRTGPKPFTTVILAWGKERAVSEVRKAMADGDVKEPFLYVEGILRNEERDRAGRNGQRKASSSADWKNKPYVGG